MQKISTRKALYKMLEEAFRAKFGPVADRGPKMSAFFGSWSEAELLELYVDVQYARKPVKDIHEELIK